VTSTATPDPSVGPDKDAALVQRMFDRVAPRYDAANTLFSAGQDRHWRRVAVRAVAPQAGEVLLDVAAGTGALAHELAAESGDGATVVALDFSYEMLRAGVEREARGRPRRSGLVWVNGDGTRLPLPDASVDAVTIGFGLRNLPDPAAGLAEFARVTRPGGRLAVLEFSHPARPPFAALYSRYLMRAIPGLARWVTSDPAAYRYLAESIRLWPRQAELAETIAAAGWESVRWKNLTGGIVALHAAVRPTAPPPSPGLR
jgi:demethylmenaquinone methyltransferase / 2-methoxy-6-polyprenyl-1,4-benzoquinol methylase